MITTKYIAAANADHARIYVVDNGHDTYEGAMNDRIEGEDVYEVTTRRLSWTNAAQSYDYNADWSRRREALKAGVE